MPELPEVETVAAGLRLICADRPRIRQVHCHRPDLRFPFPAGLAEALQGHRIEAVDRRGKYLLWHCGGLVLLNHLGMTGSWRLDEGPATHDHLELVLADGRRLLYRDPRRFGYCDLAEAHRLAEHPFLRDLGPEPLDPTSFNADYLAERCRGRRGPIKNLLMNANVVVGVGNIYAVESLQRAGIHPLRAAGRIAVPRLGGLVEAIRTVLGEAIAAGGSTIRDFRQAGGADGYFQHRFQVYGRGGEPCRRCGRPLKERHLAGRITTWCPGCQR